MAHAAPGRQEVERAVAASANCVGGGETSTIEVSARAGVECVVT